jgi:hypothetical protein
MCAMQTSLIERLIAGGALVAMTVLVEGRQLGLAGHYGVPYGAIVASNLDSGADVAAARGGPETLVREAQAAAGIDRTRLPMCLQRYAGPTLAAACAYRYHTDLG